MTNLTPKNDIVKFWPAIMFGKRMERALPFSMPNFGFGTRVDLLSEAVHSFSV